MSNSLEGKTAKVPILIVEDDDHIAQVLKFMLERNGYHADWIRDGQEAKRVIQENIFSPKLVMLDVMLPYTDGFELVKIIRAQDGWTDIPVIMLTAKTLEHDIVRALNAGANDYVVKPFQPNELLARVQRLLRNAAS